MNGITTATVLSSTSERITIGIPTNLSLIHISVIADMGINQDMGSMEGKEVRFGVDQSSLFTTVTTSFTTGTVNNMHATLTPLGGMVPMLHMMLNLSLIHI